MVRSLILPLKIYIGGCIYFYINSIRNNIYPPIMWLASFQAVSTNETIKRRDWQWTWLYWLDGVVIMLMNDDRNWCGQWTKIIIIVSLQFSCVHIFWEVMLYNLHEFWFLIVGLSGIKKEMELVLDGSLRLRILVPENKLKCIIV